MNKDIQHLTYTKFLSNIPPFRDKMTLDGIKALLHQLGNFQESLKVVHIAGTNGKGSSVKMLSSIYKSAGYKVGTFTSPYIDDYRECIHIDETMIDQSLMNLAALKVSEAYQQLIEHQLPLPTHYECITVIALLSMYLEKVDLAIVEVLMGGLNDATNIFIEPLVTLITSISLDHTEYLGSTLELIAEQKAGIIKSNCVVVVNKNPTIAKQVIEAIAKEHHAPLYYSNLYSKKHFSLEDMNGYIKKLQLNGQHQIDNLKGVLTVIKLLEKLYTVQEKHILSGLETVVHPCRVESMSTKSMNFIIDGSHNEEGILALIHYLKEHHRHDHLIFILGILKDKDLNMIQKHIYAIARQVILTQPINERTFNIKDFYQHLNDKEKAITTMIPNIEDVYPLLKSNKKQATNTLFIACGSLYVAYPFRQLILDSKD